MENAWATEVHYVVSDQGNTRGDGRRPCYTAIAHAFLPKAWRPDESCCWFGIATYVPSGVGWGYHDLLRAVGSRFGWPCSSFCRPPRGQGVSTSGGHDDRVMPQNIPPAGASASGGSIQGRRCTGACRCGWVPQACRTRPGGRRRGARYGAWFPALRRPRFMTDHDRMVYSETGKLPAGNLTASSSRTQEEGEVRQRGPWRDGCALRVLSELRNV